MHEAEANRNVLARCQSVGVDALEADHCILRLESFSCKEGGWTEVTYMCREMCEEVKFRLVEPVE